MNKQHHLNMTDNSVSPTVSWCYDRKDPHFMQVGIPPILPFLFMHDSVTSWLAVWASRTKRMSSVRFLLVAMGRSGSLPVKNKDS